MTFKVPNSKKNSFRENYEEIRYVNCNGNDFSWKTFQIEWKIKISHVPFEFPALRPICLHHVLTEQMKDRKCPYNKFMYHIMKCILHCGKKANKLCRKRTCIQLLKNQSI